MKLLICTQVLDKDDPAYFGFFHGWVAEFAKHCEKVTVICLREGTHVLPDNVRVYSLGKENGRPLFGSAAYAVRFISLAWRLRLDYDSVFVHMNPEYLILMGWFWRLRNTTSVLWYLHKSVDLKLRLGTFFADHIVTASKESFHLPSRKVVIVGHGIDPLFDQVRRSKGDRLRILTWGRLSPIKRIERMISAVQALDEGGTRVQLTVVGAPARPADAAYLQELKSLAQKRPGTVLFLGGVQHREIPALLSQADVSLNLSDTGSMDKSVLESLMAGIPVVSSNPAFAEMLKPYGLFVDNDSPQGLATLSVRATKADIAPLRDMVRREYSLSALIPRILRVFSASSQLDPKKFYNEVMPEKLGTDYEAARWEKDALLSAQHGMAAEAIRRYVLPAAKSAARILEVGPGPGTWTKLLLEANSKARYTLVDISEEMLGQAREALLSRADITFVESDFLAFGSPQPFDFFFSSRAIEYMPDKAAVAAKIASLLARGAQGAVITKTPKRFFNRLRGRNISGLHSGQIAPCELEKLLQAAGLEVVGIYATTATVPTFGSAPLNRILFKLIGRLPLLYPLTLLTESYCIVFKKP